MTDHVLHPIQQRPAVPEKRLPKYAGPIIVLRKQGNDWEMPEVMFQDAIIFLEEGRKCFSNEIRKAHRLLRASVFSAFSAFEAFLNQLADIQLHHDPTKLGDCERDFLEERRTVWSNGQFCRQKQNYSIDDRFLFFYGYYRQSEFNKGDAKWQNYRAARELRDSLTHPKPPFSWAALTPESAEKSIDGIRVLLCELIDPTYEWMAPLDEQRKSLFGTLP